VVRMIVAVPDLKKVARMDKLHPKIWGRSILRQRHNYMFCASVVALTSDDGELSHVVCDCRRALKSLLGLSTKVSPQPFDPRTKVIRSIR
jgi:hypothetical protein